MADVYVKRNDREPSVTATLRAGVTPVNLTGATCKFIMRNRADGTVKVNAACTIVTPASGIVRYDWSAGNTDTAGAFDAEFQVTTSGGRFYTFPNRGHLEVLIHEDLAD